MRDESPPGVLLGGKNAKNRMALGTIDNYHRLAKDVNARGVWQEIGLAVRALWHHSTSFPR